MNQSYDGPRTEFVPARELRALFNSEILPLIEEGTLIELVMDEGPPSARMNQAPGTLSQTVAYYGSGGVEIALVHRFLQKDGTLGGSEKPDPKRLFLRGVLYVLELPTSG